VESTEGAKTVKTGRRSPFAISNYSVMTESERSNSRIVLFRLSPVWHLRTNLRTSITYFHRLHRTTIHLVSFSSTSVHPLILSILVSLSLILSILEIRFFCWSKVATRMTNSFGVPIKWLKLQLDTGVLWQDSAENETAWHAIGYNTQTSRGDS